MRWMFVPFIRYFDLTGRSSRREYWMFFLLRLIALAALAIWFVTILIKIGKADAGPMVDEVAGSFSAGLTLFGIFILVTLIPSIAVEVRRFHDQDMSGLLVLLNL